ncbi:MAG: hypothetical protein K6G29_01265 [Clostridiales bacterium]|nr:hypothetical protein [Clostridiales bacterium]
MNLETAESVIAGDVYENTLYYLVEDKSAVYTLDLTTGEKAVLTEDIKRPRKLCASSDGIRVFDMRTDEVVRFSPEGERLDAVSIPMHVHGGDGYSELFYLSDLDFYDGLLLLAARDGVWTLAEGEKEWTKADLTLLGGEQIANGVILNRKQVVVGIENINGIGASVTQMDRNGKNQKVISEDLRIGELFANQGRVYKISSGRGSKLRLYDITDREDVYLQAIDAGGDFPLDMVRDAEASGDTLFVLWNGQPFASLIPKSSESGAVCFFAPERERERVTMMAQAVEDIPVTFRTSPQNTFRDKVNTSLLAKESEYDIILVSDFPNAITDMLTAVMKNHLYADLYGNARLKENLGAMFPGVQRMMELGGAFFALPFALEQPFYGFTGAARESGITLPSADWKADELWALADELKQNGMSFFSEERRGACMWIYLSLAESAVQDACDLVRGDPGDEAKRALTDLFETIAKYEAEGILYGDNPAFGFIESGLFLMLSIPNNPGIPEDAAEYTLMPAPSVGSAKQPVEVTGFLFVNPYSKRLDDALEVLAELTDEENRYNAYLFDAPLWPGLDRYGKVMDTLVSEEGGLTMSTIREPVFHEQYREYVEKVDAFLADYYAHSEFCLIDVSLKATQAVAAFSNGEMSAAECADILCEEFVYKLKG